MLGLGMIGSAGADRVVNFEGSQDGTNYSAISAQNCGTLTFATTATINGTTPQLWRVPLAGLRLFRARVSGGATGNVTVTGTAIAGVLPAMAASV
jgi:hypothetical protein